MSQFRTAAPSGWTGWLHASAAFLSAALLPLVALAEEPAGPHWAQPDTVFLQAADSARSRSLSIGATWDLPWRESLAGGRVGAYLEAAIGHWSVENAQGGRDTAAVTQLGLTPVFRWHPQQGGSPWFVEGGIGLNIIGPTYKAGRKRFSTAFNFGDHVAVGYQFGDQRRQEIALRLQHFSNGGIKKPNPGEDFVQLRYAVRL